MAPFRAMKGMGGSLNRIALLPTRYGLTPGRMRRRLKRMNEELNRRELIPTIHVTASNLVLHPELSRDLVGVDIGLHGYHHIDYSEVPPEGQAADLDASICVFVEHGFPVHGFRAPYLRTNQSMYDLLGIRRIEYDSSVPVIALPDGDTLAPSVEKETRRRYGVYLGGSVSSSPQKTTTELPVSMPDDEILVDALRLRSCSALTRVFKVMTRAAASKGTLLVLQIHPERYDVCSEPLQSALTLAEDLGAWKASLIEASRWRRQHDSVNPGWPNGSAFGISVTGDLDALTLPDFVDRHRRVGARRS